MKSRLPTIFVMMITVLLTTSSNGERPAPANGPAFARWLMNASSWGVLTTLNSAKAPFGNVLSCADSGSGVPLFYESVNQSLTGMYAVVDNRTSFTVTEYVLGYCGANDPQIPSCAKLTFSGRLEILNKSTPEGKAGEDALMARHPQFVGYPKAEGFDVFKLNLEEIYLVNDFAPYKNINVSDYFSSK